ncbi:MAG: C4-type zinc ribbon domain-containing protein [Gemmatimonadota bacterium]|nr:C4-type zinc ribbon domain-containing protein [Gemmatimonadota bacterium]MDP7031088.1 C4-type zinc ribbon domain-containing protein [Gemmatimonadota bacterium]
MRPEEVKALLELQELDKKLLECEVHRSVLPARVAAIEAPLAAAREAKERVDEQFRSATVSHRQCELDLMLNNEKFRKLQTQQMMVRNAVEAEAYQHEMDALKDRADSLEERGISALERIEAAKTDLPELESALEEQEKIAAAARAALDETTHSLQTIHDEASELRAPLLDAVSRPIMSYYMRLRRSGRPPFVSSLSRGACTGCGFRLPPQHHQEVRLGRKLVTCEQCGRILIWVEEKEEAVDF